MSLYKNKYRVESARLPEHDYSQPGYYFITICTRDRYHDFGEIIDNQLKSTDLGRMAEECWKNIPNHFPFVVLDEFTVMPNHIHGIIIITDKAVNNVETQNLASLPKNNPSELNYNKFGPQSKNLGSIIRGFKIGIKIYAKHNNLEFYWQPKFYDHIIRDDEELTKKREYIKNNPANWWRDRNNI